MDTNRELRSMIFCAIHLPPLPAVVSRLDRDDNAVIDEEATESSHSVIGSMMEWAAITNNEKGNAMRCLAQTELLKSFEKELAGLDLDTCKAEDLFQFYCRHTRQWLDTYCTMGGQMRFKPLQYIVTKDKTHNNMMGYTKAQFRLYTGKTPEIGALEDAYPDLMRQCAKWVQAGLATNQEEEGPSACINPDMMQQCAEWVQASISKNQEEEAPSACININDINNNVNNGADCASLTEAGSPRLPPECA